MLRWGRVVPAGVVVLGLDGGGAVHVVVVAQLDISSLNSDPEVDQEEGGDQGEDACDDANDGVDEAKGDGHAGPDQDHNDNDKHVEDQVRYHEAADLAGGSNHH